ncbi:MAG TPA: flagellar hook capping FlgD N-terminal domain-containing protein [Oscillospiraceae bacterium]|nr:flagellar hook capping FlgD N-terminal domain-containing protein [Oscillospiraceae bacterium]
MGYIDTANINNYGISSANKTGKSDSSINAKAGTTNLDSFDFLKLLAAQMSNQDVSNPTDNTQFVSQMAQFATLSAMQNMQTSADKQYASSLVGKKVVYSTTSSGGKTTSGSGIVSSVLFSSKGNTVQIDGKAYKVSDITQVINNVDSGKYYSSAGGAVIYFGKYGKPISDYSISIQYKTDAADTSKTVGVVADTGKKQVMVTLDATGGTDKLPTMTDLQKVLQGTWTWQQTTDGKTTTATAPDGFDSEYLTVGQASDDSTKNNVVQQSSASPLIETDI